MGLPGFLSDEPQSQIHGKNMQRSRDRGLSTFKKNIKNMQEVTVNHPHHPVHHAKQNPKHLSIPLRIHRKKKAAQPELNQATNKQKTNAGAISSVSLDSNM